MNSMETLSKCLSRLPGIGRRSAERIAVKLVRDNGGMLRDLVSALNQADETVCCCSKCGSITSKEEEPCRLCSDQGRDGALICVVEEPSDIIAIERSGGFHGRYHALMGKISPMKGDGPNNLRIKALIKRIEDEDVKEIILALSTDVEGDSTASYISELLDGAGVKITRLAYGLPAGSGIMYSDPVTLEKALRGRTDSL